VKKKRKKRRVVFVSDEAKRPLPREYKCEYCGSKFRTHSYGAYGIGSLGAICSPCYFFYGYASDLKNNKTKRKRNGLTNNELKMIIKKILTF